MNLFAIAAGNAEALEKALDELLASSTAEEASRLSRFAERIQRAGRIAVNMEQSVLSSFLTFAVHQNIYEWADETSVVSGAPRDEILKQKLKGYYRRRTTFDQSFEDGERFRYGALNIGGAGAPKYGEFCVVLQNRVSAERSEVAYLRADSLKTYMRRGPVLDEEALRRDAAPHERRQCLAVVKHAEEVKTHPEDRWPSVLCSESEFVEAIFTGPLVANDVEVIRMPKQVHDFRYHYAFEEFRRKLGKADRVLCKNFRNVRKLIHQQGISLEVVPDAPVAGHSA